MKTIYRHKSITTLFLLLAVAGFEFSAQAQSAGDYQTIASGSFSDITIWQKYDGANWNAATAAPTFSDGVITIASGTSVTNTATRSVDQVVVQSGALLATTTALTIAHGTGTDLDIQMHHGKKREIRLLFSALGHIVLRLRRYQIGAVRLKGIPLRGAKQLASKEIELLFKSPRTPHAHLQATATPTHDED